MIGRETTGSKRHGLWLVIRNSKEWYLENYHKTHQRKRKFDLHWSEYPCILRNREEFGFNPISHEWMPYGLSPKEVDKDEVILTAAYRLLRLKKRLFVGDWDKVINDLCNDEYSAAFGQDDRHFRQWAYNPNGLEPWKPGCPIPRHEARKDSFPLVRSENDFRGVRLKYRVWEEGSRTAKERLSNAPRWAEKIKKGIENKKWKLIQQKEKLEERVKSKELKEKAKLKAAIRQLRKDVSGINKMIKNLKGVIKHGKSNKKHQEISSGCVG
jgi:hypothetical protein